MDADAIGGSVNLITRGAPNNFRLSATLGGNYNKISEKAAPNGSFIAGKRFADGAIGLLINASYKDHELGSDNTEGKWSSDAGNFVPSDWQVREYQIRRLRQSIGATVDFRINQNNTIYLRGIYNHRNDWENRYRLKYKDIETDEGGNSIAEIRRQTKGGSKDNDNARLEDQRMWTTSLKGKHNFGDGIKLDWSAAISKASEERPNERYITWRAKDVPISLNLSDTRVPQVIENIPYEDFELKEITEEHKYTDEIDHNFKADILIPLTKNGMYKNKIKIGGRYKNKDKKRDNNFFEYTPIIEPTSIRNYGVKDYTNPNFLAGDYKVGEFTSAETLGKLDLDNSSLFEKEDKPDEYAADNYMASENVIAGYVQLNQKLGNKLSMIAGVRYEKTDIDYEGNQFDEATEAITPTKGEDNYSNFLPGLHFRYNYDKNTVFRFAWTNTIARPNYYDLVPYRAIAKDDKELAIGNPTLKPTTSMNFDIMGEKYFQSVGLISGGIFYKKINDFIYVYSENNYYDNTSGNTYQAFFQPRNGASAKLFGFEFAFQRRLDFLGSMFNNFNFYTNYTYTYSLADNPVLNNQVESDKDIKLPGTAPHIFNANLTYEDTKLTLGVSFNYSAAYLDPDKLDLTPGLERYYDSVIRLDLNASYTFTHYLRFFFEANNLTNQPLRYYAGNSDRTYQAEYYDLKFNAGLKFNL